MGGRVGEMVPCSAVEKRGTAPPLGAVVKRLHAAGVHGVDGTGRSRVRWSENRG